jgi:hypothetical protein
MTRPPSSKFRGIRSGLALSLIAGCCVLAGGEAVRAAPIDIMPIEDVRPGMKGYAVTVFSGSDTDRFEIEVIDVVRDYQPKQDAILFRSSDPRLVHSGIVGGMSGSPIYIDGKLVGALAYGYRFNKDPIGGITPIKNMLAVGDLPFRPEVLPEARTGLRGTSAKARAGAAGWADAMLGLDVSPLPARRRPAELDPSQGLAPIGAPMAVSGLGPAATRMLADQLGLVPARGGANGSNLPAPAHQDLEGRRLRLGRAHPRRQRGLAQRHDHLGRRQTGREAPRLRPRDVRRRPQQPPDRRRPRPRHHPQRRALGEALERPRRARHPDPGPPGRHLPAHRPQRPADPRPHRAARTRGRHARPHLQQRGRPRRRPHPEPRRQPPHRRPRRGQQRRHRAGRQGRARDRRHHQQGPAHPADLRRAILRPGRRPPRHRPHPRPDRHRRPPRQRLRGRQDPQHHPAHQRRVRRPRRNHRVRPPRPG